jgi:hypothetical protein
MLGQDDPATGCSQRPYAAGDNAQRGDSRTIGGGAVPLKSRAKT